MLWKLYSSVPASLFLFPFLLPCRSGWGRQVTAPRWGFTWASFSAGSLWSGGGPRLDFSSTLLPPTLFQEWCFVSFSSYWKVFNLGIAPWPWKMENTVVDSERHFCGQPLPSLFYSFLPRLLPAISRHETIQEYWEFDWLISLFFALCVCVLKPYLSTKGLLFLLIILSSFYHEEEQKGIHPTRHFMF